MDKSWMTKRKSSSEYIRGVIAFVKFASENSKRKEFIVCPCKKCSLGKTLSKEVVFDHLTSGAGIIEGYTEWIMHGEPIVASTDKEAISEAPNTVHIDSIPLHGKSNGMQDMLNDVVERVSSLEREDGPGRESHSSTQSVPDPSQHSSTSRQPQVLRRGQVNTIDEQGRRSVRTVGSPTDIWLLPEGERVVIQFNPMFQPTGPGSEKFKRIAGKIIRTGQFVKLSGNWRKQPMKNKEEMWTTLMRKFYVEPGQPIKEIKRVMFMDLAKKRRQFRYEVKNALKLKENDKVEDVIGKAERVEMFDAEDFEIQVERWLSEDDKRMAEKAKTSRSFNKFLHTLGSKSIAQLARDMEEETGETPNRSNLFVVTHTKKDGTPVNDLAGEALIKAIMDTQSPTDRMRSQGSIYWSPNDACGQVLGKEHSGRVRGVGLGPTPGKSTLYTSGTSISSAPTPREEALTLEVTNLKGLYQEQKLLVQEQKQELADIKLMLKMIMEGKQPSMGNNQEGKSLTVEEDNTEVGEDGT